MLSLEKRLKIIEYKLCLLEQSSCIQVVFSYSEIDLDRKWKGKKRFIYVMIDETNNGDSSLYLYAEEIGLKFLQTVA
jgi:hypothetical protein